jgi:nitrate/TMAO reductase-like tetraheme cytochrome c subunit
MGLLLIPFGMWRKGKKLKKGIQVSDDKLFILNLRDSKTRNAIIIFSTISIFFVISTIVGSYKAFHYTESVEFCGKLCHKVMDPEYVAYQNSPHARVTCAECHVGTGADFYVKSKMSGLRQVYKYMTHAWPTPIATPVENLRPARETCEKCHWPQKFYTNSLRAEKYFLSDSANTEWNVVLNMKVGANHAALGLTSGIHWHINPDVQIEYKANKKRDTIYWVKIIDKKTGKETIYKDDELTAKPETSPEMEARSMDCMDCHNRPAHEFRTPSHYINDLLAGQNEIAAIPWFKSATMDALKTTYSTTEEAHIQIKNKIVKFYQDKKPELYKQNSKAILSAVDGVIEAFSKNAFPEMKVTYKAYPRHIGHLESSGCFRCHNDKFKSPDGKVISKNCDLCHTIVAQGKKDSVKYVGINGSLPFVHPVEIAGAWKETNCMECHLQMY